MNNDIRFKSLNELYTRILPALRTKARELNKKGLKYVHEEDIWNYLKRYKWSRSKNLDLSDIVNDIFNIEERELDNYVRNEIRNYRRKIDQEEL